MIYKLYLLQPYKFHCGHTNTVQEYVDTPINLRFILTFSQQITLHENILLLEISLVLVQKSCLVILYFIIFGQMLLVDDWLAERMSIEDIQTLYSPIYSTQVHRTTFVHLWEISHKTVIRYVTDFYYKILSCRINATASCI